VAWNGGQAAQLNGKLGKRVRSPDELLDSLISCFSISESLVISAV
jgi:hypothetical protein